MPHNEKISLRSLMDDRSSDILEKSKGYLAHLKMLDKERAAIEADDKSSNKLKNPGLKALLFRAGFKGDLPQVTIERWYGCYVHKLDGGVYYQNTYPFVAEFSINAGSPYFTRNNIADLTTKTLAFKRPRSLTGNDAETLVNNIFRHSRLAVGTPYIDDKMIASIPKATRLSIQKAVDNSFKIQEEFVENTTLTEAELDTPAKKKEHSRVSTTIDVLAWLANTPHPDIMKQLRDYLDAYKITSRKKYRYREQTRNILGVDGKVFDFTDEELEKYCKYYVYTAYTLKYYAAKKTKELNHSKTRNGHQISAWLQVAKGVMPEVDKSVANDSTSMCMLLHDVETSDDGKSGIFDLTWRDIAFATSYASFYIQSTRLLDSVFINDQNEKLRRITKKIYQTKSKYDELMNEYSQQRKLVHKIFIEKAPELACWRGDE